MAKAPAWTEDEDDTIRQCVECCLTGKEAAAALPGRKAVSVTARAKALGLRFANPPAALEKLVRRRAVFLREDLGRLGVRWTTASRCGGNFKPDTCDYMVEAGFLKPLRDHPDHFQLSRSLGVAAG